MAKVISKINSEKHLMDVLNRISKNPAGYAVLYVSISKLKPKNRHPQFVKILAKLFDGLIGYTRSFFFILSNGDFVILGKDITQDMVDVAVRELRQGLSSDPILMNKDGSEFARVYEFPEKFNFFYNYIQDYMVIMEQPEKKVSESEGRPIQSDEIDGVLRDLSNIDISDLVKRQSVMRIKGANKFEVIFQEFFVAIKDIVPYFSKNVDITANHWLFMYISQKLDEKTLSAFKTAELKNWPKEISVNLNLSSVKSDEFDKFIKNLPVENQKVVVEVKLVDVFANLYRYYEIRDYLHEHGHKILIDEVTSNTLKMLYLNKLNPDMVKLFWEPLIEIDQDVQAVFQTINDIGKEKMILAKCDSDNALKWGVKHGITTFQGPFIDNIEVAMIRAKCPEAAKCTSLNCLKRKRLLMGTFRDGCMSKENLEELL